MRAAFLVSDASPTALRALNYSPASEAFKTKGRSRRCEKLVNLIGQMGPGYGAVFTRIDCRRDFGIELMSQSDMFATEPRGRIIRRDSIPVPDDHRVSRWQVLLAGAGTLGETELFGRPIIADGRLVDRYVGPDAFVLTFKEPESAASLYAYAFLCTRAGVGCVRATSYGTKILRFRSDLLADMPIPFGSDQQVEQVANLVRSAVEHREFFARKLVQARRPIEELKDVREAWNACSEEKARCVLWRQDLPTLSAWNYASIGDVLRSLREKWPSRISDFVEEGGIFLGPRFGRIPASPPHGIDFVSQRDVFLMRPVPRRIVRPLVPDRLLFVPPHAILLGANGQLTEGTLFGHAELAAFSDINYAITGHIMRLLISSPTEANWLFAFLSTKLGMALLRTTAIGTSVPTMHVGLLGRLPVPELTPNAKQEVNKHVQEAVEARRAAAAAEQEAIRIIEEEILPEWLA
jgi:hypothetical protein